MTRSLENGQFFGQVSRSRVVGDVTLAETRYAEGFQVPRHDHHQPYLCLVLGGSLLERPEGDAPRRLSRHGVFFHPRAMPHAEEFSAAGTRLFSVQLGAVWLDRMEEYGLTPPTRQVYTDSGKLCWIVGQLHREFAAGDPAARLAIDGLALAALAELLRVRTRPVRGARPAWLDRIVELLHARYREPPALADLAREADVHPVYLARVFRRHLGCSAGEMVQRIRIEEACRLIVAGEALARVAHATGFADQSHFSRTFRRIAGATPAAYRRDAQR